jgi:hypothetical protein
MSKASNARDATKRWQTYDINTAGLSSVAWSGSYNDLNNKPTLFSGNYADLTNKPTIPAAQVQTDWNASSGMGVLLNKPSIPTVPRIAYYTVSTDTSGVWTASLSGFTTVSHVDCIAINTANTAAGARIATLSSFSTTTATGTVCLANSITSILGLLGLGLSGAGVSVRVRVEGT